MLCKEVIPLLLSFPPGVKVVTCHEGKIMPCFDAHRIVDSQDIEGVEVGSGWVEINELSRVDREGVILVSHLIEQLMQEGRDKALFCFVDGDYCLVVGVRPLSSSLGMDGVWAELVCQKN